MARFFVGFPWRFLLVDLASWQTLMCLDTLAYEQNGSILLNKPCVFAGKVPADDPRVWLEHGGEPYLAEGVRALIGLRREGGATPWVPQFAGRLLQVQDDADDQAGPVSTYTAFDEWKYLYSQPLRTAAGALIGKNGLRSGTTALPHTRGNEIALALLQQSIAVDGPVYIDTTSGTFESTVDLDITFETATSVGQAWDQLVATGSLDIVLKPVFAPATRPFVLGELAIYAEAGQLRPQAVFAWGRAPYSARAITRLEDGSQRGNKLQFYRDDPALPLTLQTDAASVAKYGSYWMQEVLTEQFADAAAEAIAAERLRLIKNGKTIVTVSPFPERAPVPLIDYGPGDRVRTLAPKTRLRKTLDGYQRVYGIPFQLGPDQIETVENLLTSADGVA